MEFKTPTKDSPEWSDDQTMNVLYSPFRESRDINPNSWDRKLHFWSKAIMQRFTLENKAVFNTKDLPRMFERKGKLPVCLDVVIQNMIKNGHLMKINDFYSGVEKSWASWTYNILVKKPIQVTFNTFIKRPLSWTYRRLFGNEEKADFDTVGPISSGNIQNLEDQEYVVVDIVKSTAEKISDQHHSGMKNPMTDNVVGLQQLREKCASICPDDQTFQLSLLWLCKQKKCAMSQTESGEKVIVFAFKDQTLNSQLSETELRIYRLKQSSEELHHQIEDIIKEMEKCRLEAKHYLAKGMKVSAKHCLRRKKRLHSIQEKKETAIDNIHHLLSTIQQAQSDKQVLDAYSSGVEAFKDITRKYGLTPDMVDDVMIGVQEVLEDQDELNRSLSAPVAPGDPSMEELEAELDSLGPCEDDMFLPEIPHESPHQEIVDAMCQMRVVSDDLPEVPGHSPGSSPVSPRQVSIHTPPHANPAYSEPVTGFSPIKTPRKQALPS